MPRLVFLLTLTTVVPWVWMYGLRKGMKKEAWRAAKQILAAFTIGLSLLVGAAFILTIIMEHSHAY